MGIIEMDPEVAKKLLEGYQNELEPEVKALDAFYRQFKCPRCKGDCRKEYAQNHVFNDPNTLTARALLRCTRCKCLLDPHSGLVVEPGNMSQTPAGIHLIDGDE
jgi:hypothetical protein